MPRGKLVDSLTLGPARRRRRMHRLLRELDRRDAVLGLPCPSAPEVHGYAGPGHRGPVRERLRSVVVGVVTTGLVFGWVFLNYGTPLGDPPAVATGAGTFKFLAHQTGRPEVPVSYDPCRPIEILVNDTSAPGSADEIFRSALDEVSTATGLVFEVRGRTDERLGARTRGSLMGGEAPVLVDWTTPDRVPGLAGDVAGLAGSTRQDTGTGYARYVTGTVALDTPDLVDVLRRPGGDRQVRAIIMHELGHLVGLDHVDDPGELMHADNVGVTELGPGDREGLAALGAGRCSPGF